MKFHVSLLILLVGCAAPKPLPPASAPGLPPIPAARPRLTTAAKAVAAPAPKIAHVSFLDLQVNGESIAVPFPADGVRFSLGERAAVIVFSAPLDAVLETSADLATWNQIARFDLGNLKTASVFVDLGSPAGSQQKFFRLRPAQ